MPAAEQARRENAVLYGNGDLVGNYITDPYHHVRRELAASQLARLLAQSQSPSGPILEIGAGPETITSSLDTHRTVIASDLAIEALSASTATHKICLDASAPLPIKDESVSAVVIGELIEHLFDPQATLLECRRILLPGGSLVVTTPNLAGLQDRIRFLIGETPRQVDPLHPYLRLHIRPFSATSLYSMLRASGFEPMALQSNFVGWELPSGRWLQSRTLARILPHFGGSLIASARKLAQ